MVQGDIFDITYRKNGQFYIYNYKGSEGRYNEFFFHNFNNSNFIYICYCYLYLIYKKSLWVNQNFLKNNRINY